MTKVRRTKRVTGRTLQRKRAYIFSREPLCRQCRKNGFTRLANEIDHIIPLFKGGTEDLSNCQPLCFECHEKKTQEDLGKVKPEICVHGYGGRWPCKQCKQS